MKELFSHAIKKKKGITIEDIYNLWIKRTDEILEKLNKMSQPRKYENMNMPENMPEKMKDDK
jgi:hypothetical protein